ncbi:MAG: DUF3857 domain-containing transglutaminase family protein [Bacteroidales bacterium]
MIRILLLSLLICFRISTLFAGPIEDLIAKAGSSKDFPDARQVIIFDSTRVEVRESGLSYYYTHRVHKVLTPAGALDLAYVKFDYDPLTAYAEIRKVVIYRKNGTTEILDTARVLDYAAPARAIYWGAREKMIEIGRLESGDAIEVFLFKKGFTYALLQQEDDERFIPPMRGQFYDIVPFWSDEPLLEKVYLLHLPVSKQIQYHVYNGQLEIQEKEKSSVKEYIFTGRDLMPLKREPSMVDKSDVALKLLLSTSPDWQSKSTWFFGVNEDFGSFAVTEDIQKKVNEILRNAKNEDDSISLLTHWCADEIRYSGISMGKGEGFTLHTGEMTFTDRAGVCKDKAGMLITMLRGAGFKSYPAMTMAGSRIDRIPADQFNHCVTVVQRKNGQYELLDPTWVPFIRELWSSAEQQQNYLMGVPEGADLMETPVSPPELHYLKIEGLSEILPDGTLQGKVILKAEGQSDAAVRRLFSGYYRSEWNNQIEKEILKISPEARIAAKTLPDFYNYQEGPITFSFSYRIPHYAVVSKDEIIFTPLVASHLFKNSQGHLNINTSLKKRQFPYRDRCSRMVELSETIRLPHNCKFAFKPEAVALKGKNSSWEGEYLLVDKALVMNQTLVLNKRVYEAEDWPDFRQAILNQMMMAEEKVVLLKN